MYISVIIPLYKNIHYLYDSLESLKCQTYKKFEVIIINDGSPNIKKINEIIKNFRNKLKIKLINLKFNKGVSHALNIGIKKANGKYISWLSHDDYFHPKKFELQIKAIKKQNICITGFYCVTENKKIFKKIRYNVNNFSARSHIIIRDNLNFCTILLQKKIFSKVGYFNEKLRHVQDYDMMFRIFKIYDPILLNECLLFSRFHDGQNSRKYIEKAYNEKEIFYLSKYKELQKIFNASKLLKKILITFFIKRKNLNRLNSKLLLEISKENIFFKLILKMVYVFCGYYQFFKK